MKQVLFFVITFISIFQTTFAEEYSFYANAPTGQRLYYKINGDNVTVCCPGSILPFAPWNGFAKPTGNLTIPSSVTYNGTTYSVTNIGQDAFYRCDGLSSVIIPNTVTQINIDAFLDCSGLTSVTIGNSVTTIGIGAFMNCSSLTSVTIPNSVIHISNRAFMNCTGLTTLTIGNSVTIICEYAFRKCTSLTSLTIPNSVLTIEQCSFDSCINLTTVNIGNSVNHIVNNPFKYCNNLSTIVVNSGNNHYDSRNNCNAIIKTATNELVTGCKNTVIPNSVSSIGALAFKGCSTMTEITSLATQAPSLGNHAFDGVPSIIPIYIPCGSAASYDSIWTYFPNQIERPGFFLNVTSDNDTMGFAQVLSSPTCSDSMATILATAYTGYHFTNWSDGSSDNPRQIAVTHDIELTAHFNIDTFSVVVISSDSTRGSVEGGGKFVYQSLCTIEAIANNGYHFHHWSTGAWSNPLTFLVTYNSTNIAYFEADSGTDIEEISLDNINIFTQGDHIVVEGTTDEVRVFDITGRHIRNEALPAGVYIVKISNHFARKVVVIK